MTDPAPLRMGSALRPIGSTGAICADGVCSLDPGSTTNRTTETAREGRPDMTLDPATRFAITDLIHQYGTAIDTRDEAVGTNLAAAS